MMKTKKNYLFILFFLPCITFGQTDFQKIQALFESDDKMNREFHRLPSEYFITTKSRISVKEENKLSIKNELLYNPDFYFETVLDFESIKPILFDYKNGKLQSRTNRGLTLDKYYYLDTLNIIEYYEIRNGIDLIKSERYLPGNNDQYYERHDIIPNPLFQPDDSRTYDFHKRYETVNQSIFEFSSFNRSRTRTVKGKKHIIKTQYQQTLGKKRISEKIYTIGNRVEWHLIYQYKIEDNNLVVTISNRNEIGYFLIEKYDPTNRLIEKGIYHKRNGTPIKYFILNIINYNPDSIIISEYKNTFYSETDLDKNLSKVYAIKKDSFKNKIKYSLSLVNGDVSFLQSDIDNSLEENYLLSERGYKDRKHIYTCSYIYNIKDNIVNKVQCVLNLKATEFEEGIIYYKERLFE
ncbi:hypothetical protein [Aquimarina litoralis]|uniref:hypothetical protein n=1 Tax=Aquimarina litoralis TaxID=584605 RepID=UPI001C5A1195|nr:hypothetical protein [Aquimarina litoralis]MBW1297824.1 hypothetical protein [Aquimarina litoralis]